MADTILNNYSDDSKIKRYIQQELMPKVFHDIPLNVLNTGEFSIINEYISQATEQMAFTSAFYFNEAFITKSVLPDSIYAEAAIFNIGYAFATPSATQILLELKLSDLFAITQKNESRNEESGLYEFILDKNTLINLPDGQTYSLDYDISLQYQDVATASDTRNGAWIVQYINDEQNSISINKNKYISYRVTENWLCLFIDASEYTRTVHTVVNNMTDGVPNPDTLIECTDHICGFDVVYIEPSTSGDVRLPLRKDHILAIHDTVKDTQPYVHYIMDNSQTIRLMWQLNGNRGFVPKLNSRFEITVYTCHGKSSNFTEAPSTQPNVITATDRYKNNANVLKAAFIISGSLGGTDIGNAENVRRKTIEAYNTANVISTDHDIEEWFKTFYFENILYPFFFKRRDDPWGRIWSGFLALTNKNNEIYRTNTLHAKIGYNVLYDNNDNNVSNNEIIIPPGWVWTYGNENLYTVIPYTLPNSTVVEEAKTKAVINQKFVFANPFGIRIQKEPFAIGYFNPWINESLGVSRITKDVTTVEDSSQIYHATPLVVNIKRTYLDDHYHVSFWLDVSQSATINGNPWVKYLQRNAVYPIFNDITWNYFKEPTDIYASNIPMLSLQSDEGYIPFDPYKTYLCVNNKNKMNNGRWALDKLWIIDGSKTGSPKRIDIDVSNADGFYGLDSVWGDNGISEPIYITGDTTITLDGLESDDVVEFERSGSNDYCMLRIKQDLKLEDSTGNLRPVQIQSAKFTVTDQYLSERTKYGEAALYHIGEKYEDIVINAEYEYIFTDVSSSVVGVIKRTYTVYNAADVFLPYPVGYSPEKINNNMWVFKYPTTSESTVSDPLVEGTVLMYADMKPSPTSASVDYYRIPMYKIRPEVAAFYVINPSLPLDENNLRVVLHAFMNGAETGYIEMRPVEKDSDGTFLFETDMYMTNELVDVDNRIHIASIDNSGGSWIPTTSGSVVNIDATDPKLQISILFKAETNPDLESPINGDSTFNGYYENDLFEIDSFSLIQELKEMRSVVNFGDTSIPTFDQYISYTSIMKWNEQQSYNTWNDVLNFANNQYLYKKALDDAGYREIYNIADFLVDTWIPEFEDCYDVLPNDSVTKAKYDNIMNVYTDLLTKFTRQARFTELYTYEDDNVVRIWKSGKIYYTNEACTDVLDIDPSSSHYPVNTVFMLYYSYANVQFFRADDGELKDITESVVMWAQVVEAVSKYSELMNDLFSITNVNGGLEVQLVPFVERNLMNSEEFGNFVATFTQVHKAIEPVIFKRLEGNNYLDCKLVATYGKPHTYCSDKQYKQLDNQFWPDLNVQISFDVKLYNKALAPNTISELKTKIKAYFNRLTTVHTPVDRVSMNNNIYVSHIVQQLEEHNNVAYVKFNGWYTNEISNSTGNYMDATVQAIVQRWRKLEDMPTDELERFVPEMFVLNDNNIELNIIDDFTLA